MSPLDRRRRRRRRTDARTLVTVGAALLALLIVIGGVAHISASSLGYREAVNRSFAAQASLVVERSNQSGRTVNQLMVQMPAGQVGRVALEDRLATLADDTNAQATAAAGLVPPATDPAGAGSLADVLSRRAYEVARLRSAIEGLFGLTPLTPGEAANGTEVGASGAPPAPALAGPQVAADVTSVGVALAGADRAFVGVRRQLRQGPGHAVLPPSVWMSDPRIWAPGPATTLVDELTASPALAPKHLVQLQPQGVRIDPAALPTPPVAATAGLPGLTVIPPTGSLTVSALVVNQGNVAEHGLVVTASLQPQGAGRASSAGSRLALEAGRSAVVALPPMVVANGNTYVLTVAVTPPAGQTTTTGLSVRYPIEVGPPVGPSLGPSRPLR